MRRTLGTEIRSAFAGVARLQCVAYVGVSRTAFAITYNRISLESTVTRKNSVFSSFNPGTPFPRCRFCQRKPVGVDLPIHRIVSTVALVVHARQKHCGPSAELVWRGVVGAQSLKFTVVGEARANVNGAVSHPPTMSRRSKIGEPTWGVEH
jgi:hypothetical protein